MLRELMVVGFAALMSVLLMVKTDQQLSALLEGKVWRLRLEPGVGEKAYRQRKRWSSVLLSVAGFVAGAFGILLFVDYDPWFVGVGVGSVGLILAVAGLCGRLGAFITSDKELDALARPQ